MFKFFSSTAQMKKIICHSLEFHDRFVTSQLILLESHHNLTESITSEGVLGILFATKTSDFVQYVKLEINAKYILIFLLIKQVLQSNKNTIDDNCMYPQIHTCQFYRNLVAEFQISNLGRCTIVTNDYFSYWFFLRNEGF